MDGFNTIASIAFGMLAAWVILEQRESYIPLQTDPGDDPSKYYASPMEVLDDTLYVTNPESLYAGFSLEPGKTVQKSLLDLWWIVSEMSRKFQVYRPEIFFIPSGKMPNWKLKCFQNQVPDQVKLKCFPQLRLSPCPWMSLRTPPRRSRGSSCAPALAP